MADDGCSADGRAEAAKGYDEVITKARVEQLLRVDFETGELFWINHYQRPDLIGRRAGHLNNGYWRLAIDGTEYYACQIVWLLYHGTFPLGTLDHINTNKAFDAIDNLRDATKAQNAANSKMNIRNTSGYKGIYFYEGRWRATIRINGTQKHLGSFDDPEVAHQAWLKAATTAWGEEYVRAE